jgi:alpha-glucuronidase
MRVFALLALAIALLLPMRASAEDGYDLWLRYRPLETALQARYRPLATAIVSDESGATNDRIAAELNTALGAMLGAPPPAHRDTVPAGAIVFGTPKSPRIAALRLPLGRLGDQGYVIRSVTIDGKPATVIAGNTSIGALYGAFRFLKLVQTGEPIDRIDIADKPRHDLRLLNHWDNLDRHVERGYAGQSLWDWQKLPGYDDPRYTDYARANASIGINGTVLNNVNSNADILTEPFLKKVAKLADIFRPYGIRVYLSARFSAPIEIGGLKTADPLDPQVAAWWKAKTDEVYRHIPDFGGYLVKANSEGQPGPQDYGRSHADGANMLAAAVRPHGGVVMWRAFVYANEKPDDRAKQAYTEFQPLDGTFADNVIVQVKNGAIDFQPREPFHPLFGAMPKTQLMMEFQITKEYLGFATHLVYLGSQWEEVLRADTHRPRAGSTVADILTTPVRRGAPTAIAGVANIGTDRNWSGSQFDQANWYAYGRLAWNPDESAAAIAADWSRMTWGNDPTLTKAITGMMMRSHQAVVDYMTPLGLNHLMATGHHYGPGPWVDDLERRDWNPTYFHAADADGIGFDRTRTGSNAVAQYAKPVAERFGSLKTVGDDYLLWFHHVPWDHRMSSGRMLWDELVVRYDRGVGEVDAMRAAWAGLSARIDPRRHAEVSDFLGIQREEAQWWRDASIAYFASLSKRALPSGHTPPPHPLDYYKAIKTPYAPGN